jgi:4a-hydroxytetrahydrobiopterin dehydratase
MSDLAAKKCEPCDKDTAPLGDADVQRLLGQLDGWSVTPGAQIGPQIEKEYRFPDFKEALAFVNRVGEVAEQEGHHPDISFTWGKVRLAFSTHSIGGLSENDFILAAKADGVR